MANAKKPGGAGCIVSLILIVAAIAVGIWGGVSIFKSGMEMFTQMAKHKVVVPSTTELNLEKAGPHMVFHEFKSTVGGKTYNVPAGIGVLQCRLTSKATGEQVAMEPAQASANYDLPKRSGILVMTFKIDAPGAYELTAQYPGSELGPETVLAIGPTPDKGDVAKMGTACVAFPVAGICGPIGIIVGIVWIVRRSKAKKQPAAGTFPPAQ